jgi:hypothetical protein
MQMRGCSGATLQNNNVRGCSGATLHEWVNAITMVPGAIAALFMVFPYLPYPAMTYIAFCMCSAYYHIIKATHQNANNKEQVNLAFKLDIISQHVACFAFAKCRGASLLERVLILLSLTNVVLHDIPPTYAYVSSGICIFLANGIAHSPSVFWWTACFATFALGKITKRPWCHGLFHIFGHLGWLSNALSRIADVA